MPSETASSAASRSEIGRRSMTSRETADACEAQNVEAYLDADGAASAGGRRAVSRQQADEVHPPRAALRGGSRTASTPRGAGSTQGETDDDPSGAATVGVAFGPQYGPVTARRSRRSIRASRARLRRPGLRRLQLRRRRRRRRSSEADTRKLRIHMAHIRPDVNPGMDGLLKEQPGSQLFTVFGQPRTTVDGPDEDGEYTVTMEGVDIYDPVDNTSSSRPAPTRWPPGSSTATTTAGRSASRRRSSRTRSRGRSSPRH